MTRTVRRIHRAAAALAVLGVLLMTPTTHAEDALGPLRWELRVLLVFSPHADDARAREMDARLAARGCEIADRDLVVGRIPAVGQATLADRVLSPAAVARLRAEYGVGAGAFAVVLVGKDGGAKVRTASVPDLDELFGRIDTMPMRRAEMRAEPGRCGG